MTAIKYIIEIPEDAIPELEALMARRGAYFHPVRQVVAINDIFMESSTAMGHHAGDLVREVNRHLDQLGLTPRVPEDHGEWGPARMQAFLTMAVMNFRWEDGRVEEDWWKDDGKTWDEVALENPGAFGKNQE